MTIEAKIITDSVSPVGARLTTFQLKYPRFIHAELMTHRVFSRNASSSRAIPVEKIIQQVIDEPAMPVHWGKNQRGMQADEEVVGEMAKVAEANWLAARDKAVVHARNFVEMGIHKQIANRILEPWHHIHVVCTATNFDNFFALRCHPDAQPEIKVLAEQMRDLYFSNDPSLVEYGQWHMPYLTEYEQKFQPRHEDCLEHHGNLLKASTARCARVSYMTHDNEHPTLEKDLGLYTRLFDSKHMSPFEHPATPMMNPKERSGNFVGWTQYRKTIKGECFDNYQPPKQDD